MTAPVSWIRLTVQGSRFSSSMIAPSVRLNGYPVKTDYGTTSIPVPPGQWHVDVHCQWMLRYGQAAYDLHLAEGQAVDLSYAPPWHQFARGRIGTTPQKRPGGWFIALVWVMLVAVVALAILVGAFAS